MPSTPPELSEFDNMVLGDGVTPMTREFIVNAVAKAQTLLERECEKHNRRLIEFARRERLAVDAVRNACQQSRVNYEQANQAYRTQIADRVNELTLRLLEFDNAK